jgi:hypothetical protein
MKFNTAYCNALPLLIMPLLLASCSHSSASKVAHENKAQATFFSTLSSLCGQRFEGLMTFPLEGQDSFSGKTLVAQFASCTEKQVTIPFAVGDDRSRTWIVSRLDNGLQLKHDHRHKDGTPDDINLYGGLTKNLGTMLSQSFHADAHTATIIPAASTNVWTMSFNKDYSELTYHLERHQQDRFTAVLKRVTK